jgi:hypothetical protein
MQQSVCDGYCADRLVGEIHAMAEEHELLRAMVIELVDRADNVTDDCAEQV